MTSTFNGLNIMSRGLYVEQASLDTVGHNISNANTDGYSRQRVNLVTMMPAGEVYGMRGVNQAGTGAQVGSITRARDVFTDTQYWNESSTKGASQTGTDVLGKIENIFNEPSDTGIQTLLNQFWTSWQTLSTNAADSGTRATVAQKGVAVANAVHTAYQQLNDNVTNINTQIDDDVKTINQITSEIAKLNQQIAFTEVGGKDHANDLRDSRDLLVDQLSKLVDVSVNEDSAGNYKITTSGGGLYLVSGNSNNQLNTDSTATDPTFGYTMTKVYVASDPTKAAVNFKSGEVQALLDSRDSTGLNGPMGINGYMSNLNKISQFFLQDFNAVHRSGYGTDNVNNRNFFGADSPTDYTVAANAPANGNWINLLQVNPDITDTPSGLSYIAAKTTFSLVSAVTTGTTNTGSATFSPTGSYNGSNPTDVIVQITDTGSVKYSTDKGATWSGDISGAPSISINGMTVNIGNITNPTAGNTDYYNFTMSEGEELGAVTTGTNNAGSAKVSATGAYTGGAVPTDVSVTVDNLGNINYSTDGGTTWNAYAAPFICKGMTVTIAPSGNLPTGTMLDHYSFTLSEGNNNASGDNAILLGKRLKTDLSATLGNMSLDSYYNSMISTLGVQSQDVQRQNTNQQTIVDQLTNLRQSVSGVNMDEEMTNMIQFQKGYNAAARVLTAMDEMLDKLINGTGMVGR